MIPVDTGKVLAKFSNLNWAVPGKWMAFMEKVVSPAVYSSCYQGPTMCLEVWKVKV